MYWMKSPALGLMLSMKPIDLPLAVVSRWASVARSTPRCPTGLTSFTVFAAVMRIPPKIVTRAAGSFYLPHRADLSADFRPADDPARPHHRRIDIKHRREAEAR